MVDRQGTREVGEEDDARLQRPDEQRLAAGVVGGEFGPELVDPRCDLLGGEVDVADSVVGGAQEARWSPYRRARRSMSRR
jgi:hypothetical protein